jgi:hypothetical protein
LPNIEIGAAIIQIHNELLSLNALVRIVPMAEEDINALICADIRELSVTLLGGVARPSCRPYWPCS